MSEVMRAYERHAAFAADAFALFKAWAPLGRRVPGCDTVIRLGWWKHCAAGRLTIEEAASGEYLFRWRLALEELLNQRNSCARPHACSYAPHALGM